VIRTRIELCGRLAIEIEGERLEQALPGRQGRLLFAYLALNRRRPVRRDELIDALWPDQPPDSADSLLRPALSRLRKAIGGRVGGRGEPALLLPDDAWIDWEAAHAGLAATREAVKGDDGVPELRQSVEVVEMSPNRHQHARSLLALGEALLRRGQLDEARDLLGRTLELAEAR
jgi:DNA-binding SARP family transcriptional activator